MEELDTELIKTIYGDFYIPTDTPNCMVCNVIKKGEIYDEGIFALAIVFPMVGRDKARIRNQMNAGMSRDDLDMILRVYEKLGKELKII